MPKINIKIIFILILFIPVLSISQTKKEGPYIPLDKKLDSEWVASLFNKEPQKVYKDDEIKYIAMPCGGIGAGQVEVTGDGRISFTESVYNKMQKPNDGHGLSTGYQYLHPKKPTSKVENSFSIILKEKGSNATVYKLNDEDFDDIRFVGEYPMAHINYRKAGVTLPVEIKSTVFSPFVPLDLRNSANPVTAIKYSITNTSGTDMDVSIVGWLKNISFPVASKVKQVNSFLKSGNMSGITFEMETLKPQDSISKHAQFGGFSLSVLSKKADFLVKSLTDNDLIKELVSGNRQNISKEKMHFSSKAIGGSLSSSLSLKPGETKEMTFLVSWYFPNSYEVGRRYKDPRPYAPGRVGHIYNNWYSNSFDVAKYVGSNFKSLYSKTMLFRDTYNDNTLPYWLSNRITMPVSTLAAGNISIWENGRMYAYEGVGFCMGTCGHVYNFVTTISKLFPKLERSVRLEQDFKLDGPFSGYSKSGRINFRGYGGENPNYGHSYASDAQSGYVLKAYREHLMSPNNDFLDLVWDEVKGAIGFQIFKDGAEIGLEPNGVLEGKQTFWDPMWYGPNPYNNTLYLAALRAAEEMAKIKGEVNLAQRYHRIFEKGQKYMNEAMWNGEYYVHLYPNGFSGSFRPWNGFVSPEEKEHNAIEYIKNFNKGESNYFRSSACDASQLIGQNFAHQLGLGHILPPENCRSAANSIFRYNYTPDISTVYNYEKPKKRTLATTGEGAMVSGSWPKEKPREFENTHDKTDIWSGVEYAAACDMINEGLVKEALIAIRSIHDRYNGAKRNPWNEIEGSDHYSRAMHSWNILLSLSGFTYNGPAGKMGFNPRITPNNFKSFFSTAEGWGTISQQINDKQQKETIEVKWGDLRLKQLKFSLNEPLSSPKVTVTLDGKSVLSTYKIIDGNIIISLKSELMINTKQEIVVKIS